MFLFRSSLRSWSRPSPCRTIGNQQNKRKIMAAYIQTRAFGPREARLCRHDLSDYGHTLLALIVSILFLLPSAVQAEAQTPKSIDRNRAVPTFDDFRQESLPRGNFYWCGSQERLLIEAGGELKSVGESKGVSAPFKPFTKLQCDSSGENVIFTDGEGQVAEFNIRNGTTSVLAKYQDRFAVISVAPDLTKVASNKPVSLAPNGRIKEAIVLDERTTTIIWKNDSSMLFSLRTLPSAGEGSANRSIGDAAARGGSEYVRAARASLADRVRRRHNLCQ